MDTIVRRKTVKEMVGGISDSTLDRWIKTRGFPKPVPLGESTSLGWAKSEICAWIQACISGRVKSQDSNETSPAPAA